MTESEPHELSGQQHAGRSRQHGRAYGNALGRADFSITARKAKTVSAAIRRAFRPVFTFALPVAPIRSRRSASTSSSCSRSAKCCYFTRRSCHIAGH